MSIRPGPALGSRAGMVTSYDTGFSPLELSGLGGWYDASAITSLNDADEVATWTDLSGNGNDLVKSTNGPEYKTGIQNGLPVVRFNGTDDNLQCADNTAFRGTSGFSVLLVASLTHSGAASFIMGTRAGITSLFGWNIYMNLTTDGREEFRGGSSGSNQVWWETSTDFGAEATWAVRAYDYRAGASQSFRHNGTAYITGTDTGVHDAGTALFTLMAETDFGTFTAGDIAELIICEPDISTAERRSAELYLSAKWGVTIV